MNAIEALRKVDECIRINKLRQTSGSNLTKWNRVVNTLFHAREALSTPTSEAEGWKLVPLELVDEMRKAWFAELERWGTRRNKGEKLPYEVYRHSSDKVVSPVVMERFAVEGDAERCQFCLETAAAYRAMLAVAPAHKEGEHSCKVLIDKVMSALFKASDNAVISWNTAQSLRPYIKAAFSTSHNYSTSAPGDSDGTFYDSKG